MSNDKTIITDAANLSMLQPAKRKRACLVQYNGASLGRRYIIDQPEMIIGRAPTATICVAEDTLSKIHAKCFQLGDSVDIEDLNSTNGTFLNDRRIEQRTTLRDGDILRLGSVLFKFFAHENIENVFHDKIYRMATIDAGTEIFNKKYLMETLDSEFRFSRAYQRPLSLIIYDLDFFKKVNDTHGHNAGDFILKESAQIAKSVIRKDDILGRFGGEEFCVILPNTDGPTAHELAERIRKKIESHLFSFEDKQIQQTISMGIAEIAGSVNSAQTLMEIADQKLYQSKREGRNRVTR